MESTHNPAILLIEDDPRDVVFMRHAVEESGIKGALRVVGDGQAAIDYLSGKGDFANRAVSPLPGMIFLDLRLPVLSGVEVLRWIRSQPAFSKIVVIVVTGSREEMQMNEAYRVGANSIMIKPPTPDKLIALARTFKLWGFKRGKSAPGKIPGQT